MKFWEHPFLFSLLIPLSWPFLCITSLRNWMYDQGWLRSYDSNAMIISIGNITVGGTGKTPITETVAREMIRSGKTVAIQSRGYGRTGKGLVTVSDGRTLLAASRQSGDEPRLLAQRLPGVPVVVGSNRLKAVQYVRKTFHPDVVLLDDAFQHRRIRRRFDIVTMDAAAPLGNGHLLPAGPLRETPNGLKRAQLIILTRSDQTVPEPEQITALRKWTSAKIITSSHQPVEWVRLGTNQIFALNRFENKSAVAFAGIGNPDSFRQTLNSLKIRIENFMQYPDHYWYHSGSLQNIMRQAVRSNAEAVLTTEKDGVRLTEPADYEIPIYCLRIQCDLHMKESLNDLIESYQVP